MQGFLKTHLCSSIKYGALHWRFPRDVFEWYSTGWDLGSDLVVLGMLCCLQHFVLVDFIFLLMITFCSGAGSNSAARWSDVQIMRLPHSSTIPSMTREERFWSGFAQFFLVLLAILSKSYGVILSSRMVNWQWVVHGPKNVFMMYWLHNLPSQYWILRLNLGFCAAAWQQLGHVCLCLLYRILALWSALVLSPPSYQALAIFIRFWLLPIEVGRHGLATGCYLLEREIPYKCNAVWLVFAQAAAMR